MKNETKKKWKITGGYCNGNEINTKRKLNENKTIRSKNVMGTYGSEMRNVWERNIREMETKILEIKYNRNKIEMKNGTKQR